MSVSVRTQLARMFGRDVVGSRHLVPCRTSRRTLGVVNGRCGTAWEVDIKIDERPPRSSLAELPEGWQGLDLDQEPLPSVHAIGPTTWLRPRCVARGLRTIDGDVGEDQGEFVLAPAPYEWLWLHGLPPWIAGTSVTVLDGALHALQISPTRKPHAGFAVERVRVGRFLTHLGAEVDPDWLAQGELIAAIMLACENRSSEQVSAAVASALEVSWEALDGVAVLAGRRLVVQWFTANHRPCLLLAEAQEVVERLTMNVSEALAPNEMALRLDADPSVLAEIKRSGILVPTPRAIGRNATVWRLP